MKRYHYIFLIFGFLALSALLFSQVFKKITPARSSQEKENTSLIPMENIQEGSIITLPPPSKSGSMSVEEALSIRRSIRTYSPASLSLPHLSQMLWAAQGINNERGFRTAPSAGATFPLEMYLVANRVEGLPKGIYHYKPMENQIELIHHKDVAQDLARASLSQQMISDAAIVLIFGAIIERTSARYGERGYRYVLNEIGHAGQNVHLQAASLSLGTVAIGAYRDEEVEAILNLPDPVKVLYMMPVGHLE